MSAENWAATWLAELLAEEPEPVEPDSQASRVVKAAYADYFMRCNEAERARDLKYGIPNRATMNWRQTPGGARC